MNEHIKFRHYRAIQTETSEDVILFKTIDPRGGATLAYTTDNVGDTPMTVGSIAYCAPCDNYRKAYGRAKAKGRLQQNAATSYKLTDHDKHFAYEGDDERAFLSLLDEHMRDYGYAPR